MIGKAAETEVDDTSEDHTIEVGVPSPVPRPLRGDVNIGVGGVLLGRYRIKRRLGAGGLGMVYEAADRVRSEHAHIDAHVALKIVQAGANAPASVLDKLRHEFYCAQALSHPSIVKVYELEGSDDVAFFTMELLDGDLLSDLMKRSQPKGLARPQAWTLIREIGDGLAHAHSRNIVHGGVTPHNVMVLKSGGLRVLDFGAAGSGAAGSGAGGSGAADASAPSYASCQVLGGADPDQRDDVFALACLAYELLTGEHPFQRRLATEARDADMTPREPRNLSQGQWQALQRGLAWENQDRPNSMQEWLTQLVLSSSSRGKRARDEDTEDAGPYKSGVATLRWALAAALPVALVAGWAVVHSLAGKPTVVEAPLLVKEAEQPVPAPLPTEGDLNQIESKMPDINGPAETAAVAAPKVRRLAAKPVGPVVEKIAFEAHTLSVDPGARFAEIHVLRSAARGDKTNFVWWTEPGSAAPEADFQPQGHTTAYFPAGNHMTTLFVKLVPNAKRKKPQVFYLNIADASSGAAIGTTSRTAITLLPRGA